jgi:tRNA-splicing ligase RtcB
LPDPDLAYLVEGTEEFGAYIRDMRWAQEYAAANRESMMDAALACMSTVLDTPLYELDRINCHHNFTQREHHHGRNMWITRKGAIKADVNDRGVIPGSMGASTYIVTGLGNPASYASCSHGAGRRMSRRKANEQLDEATLRGAMIGQAWNDKAAARLVDEHPQAYKDVRDVMAAQADLVRIDHTLRSVLNYKGV